MKEYVQIHDQEKEIHKPINLHNYFENLYQPFMNERNTHEDLTKATTAKVKTKKPRKKSRRTRKNSEKSTTYKKVSKNT